MQDKKIKTKSAVVVSKSGDKSIRVVINFKIKHPKYGKYIKKRSILSVHDQHNKAALGDTVEISQCRPISKTKSWRIVSILEKSADK